MTSTKGSRLLVIRLHKSVWPNYYSSSERCTFWAANLYPYPRAEMDKKTVRILFPPAHAPIDPVGLAKPSWQRCCLMRVYRRSGRRFFLFPSGSGSRCRLLWRPSYTDSCARFMSSSVNRVRKKIISFYPAYCYVQLNSLVREPIANPCMDFQKSMDINMDIHDFWMTVFNYSYKLGYPYWYPSTDIHARTFRYGYP